MRNSVARFKENRHEAKRLAENMKHVEAVLKMMDPAVNLRLIAPRRRNKQTSPYKRGEVFRAVLGVLREADRPLTSREISETLLHEVGITSPSLKQIRDMVGSVHSSLRNHEGNTIERADDHFPARRRLKG